MQTTSKKTIIKPANKSDNKRANMPNNKMTPIERRAIFSLSSIMSLRMIGLFMVLPIFSLYAIN